MSSSVGERSGLFPGPASRSTYGGVREKYADSEAMVAHVGGFLAKWAERFLAAVDVTRFTVYGSPNAAAKAMLDGFGAVYLGPWGGFSR
jgi:hypothetical protein